MTGAGLTAPRQQQPGVTFTAKVVPAEAFGSVDYFASDRSRPPARDYLASPYETLEPASASWFGSSPPPPPPASRPPTESAPSMGGYQEMHLAKQPRSLVSLLSSSASWQREEARAGGAGAGAGARRRRGDESRLAALQETVCFQRDEISALKQRLAELDPALRRFSTQLASKAEERQEEAARSLRSRKQELAELRGRVGALEEEKAALRAAGEENEKLRKKVKQLERRATTAALQAAKARKEAETQQQHYQGMAASAATDAHAIQSEAGKLLNRKVARDHEVFGLKKQVVALQQQAEVAAAARARAQEELAGREARLRALRERNAVLEKQLQAEAEARRGAEEARGRLERALRVAEGGGEELRGEAARLRAAHQKLERQLRRAREAEAGARAELEEAHRRNAELQEEKRLTEEEAQLMATMLCGSSALGEHVQDSLRWRELAQELERSADLPAGVKSAPGDSAPSSESETVVAVAMPQAQPPPSDAHCGDGCQQTIAEESLVVDGGASVLAVAVGDRMMEALLRPNLAYGFDNTSWEESKNLPQMRGGGEAINRSGDEQDEPERGQLSLILPAGEVTGYPWSEDMSLSPTSLRTAAAAAVDALTTASGFSAPSSPARSSAAAVYSQSTAMDALRLDGGQNEHDVGCRALQRSSSQVQVEILQDAMASREASWSGLVSPAMRISDLSESFVLDLEAPTVKGDLDREKPDEAVRSRATSSGSAEPSGTSTDGTSSPSTVMSSVVTASTYPFASTG
eukprot:jgi/Tetstr1/423376/TSEL_014063.t1